jgi:hypothetical protein
MYVCMYVYTLSRAQELSKKILFRFFCVVMKVCIRGFK